MNKEQAKEIMPQYNVKQGATPIEQFRDDKSGLYKRLPHSTKKVKFKKRF